MSRYKKKGAKEKIRLAEGVAENCVTGITP